MRIMYITDDRSSYNQGYYYSDWLNIFKNEHSVTVWGPDTLPPSKEAINSTDLLVIGHGGQDCFFGHFLKRLNFLSPTRRFVHQFFRTQFNCPKVMLSKNDYKGVSNKAALAKQIGVDLVVTHSKNAVPEFKKSSCNVAWLAFGVDNSRFVNLGLNRDIDIGFRGNLNTQWNGGVRKRLVEETVSVCRELNLDIQASSEGEKFLSGDAYVNWLNKCKMVLNSPSAIDTAGPKFWESMAAGAVPIAPIGIYEGLMEPDVHYLAIRQDLADLKDKVRLFLRDSAFREALQAGGKEIVTKINMKALSSDFWNILYDMKLVR